MDSLTELFFLLIKSTKMHGNVPCSIQLFQSLPTLDTCESHCAERINGDLRAVFSSELTCTEQHHRRQRSSNIYSLLLLASQQRASVFQGRICSDNFTCRHTEIEVADETFYLAQSQNTETGPTSPSAEPILPDAWQGIHWSAIFNSLV